MREVTVKLFRCPLCESDQAEPKPVTTATVDWKTKKRTSDEVKLVCKSCYETLTTILEEGTCTNLKKTSLL
jgi:YgiT-type zinc finger domain-containing protein